MKPRDLFKEYIWLVNTISNARQITFEELQAKWLETEMSGGVELAKSTFHRHKDDIQDIFGIYIDCDCTNGYRYHIGNDEVLKDETVQNWMLSTLSVNNIVSESLALQNRIVLETVPCNDFLQTIIDAMKKKVRIDVTYRKYESAEPTAHNGLEPYCIKLSKQRWYMLAHSAPNGQTPNKDFAIYSFDRIVDIKLTDNKFDIDADFDAKSFFDECYGVVIGDGTLAQRVVIRAYGVLQSYLRDLPIHSSQEEITHGDGYTDYAYYIRPTADFVGYLMSWGDSLKVLEPQTLADNIKGKLRDACKRYDD